MDLTEMRKLIFFPLYFLVKAKRQLESIFIFTEATTSVAFVLSHLVFICKKKKKNL